MSSETIPIPAIKRRQRPQPRARASSIERDEGETVDITEEEAKLPLADLIELRKLRKAREGIDVAKLNKGNTKRKKRLRDDPELVGGLRKGANLHDDDDDEEEKNAKTRRVVRANNFTQQTNALDVDKHMLAYIEENLQIRSKPREESDDEDKAPLDPQEALYSLADKWRVEKQKAVNDGSVTNSMQMLTAIPEVDLGMDTRLKNIEETEKAKLVKAEERHEKKKTSNDEDHLVATRFYRPNLRPKSDADILRDAKLEAMGLPPQDDSPRRPNHDRHQTATDEMVMERFKKRMRK